MIPPITRSHNVRSFVPLNFTVLYVVCRFPLISDITHDMSHVVRVVMSLLVSDMSKNHALHGGQAA